jgi:hypothetical protein
MSEHNGEEVVIIEVRGNRQITYEPRFWLKLLERSENNG